MAWARPPVPRPARVPASNPRSCARSELVEPQPPDPRRGVVDLAGVGRVSGPSHSRRRAAAPPRRSIPATNSSPLRYCSILRSIPVIRSIARSKAVRCSRRPWNRAEMRSTPGTRSLPTASMTWSPNPSSRLITAWVSRNSERCSSVIRRSIQCWSSRRPSPRSGGPSASRRVAAQRRRSVAEQRQLSLQALGDVRPQPGVSLELEGVGRLVQRDPRAERAQRHAHGCRGLADVLLDEQQPPGRGLGGEQREVVLAEDPLAHEPEQQRQLARGDPAVRHRHRGLGDAAPRRQHWSSSSPSSRPMSPAKARRVGAHPGGPVHDLDPLDDARQLRAEMRASAGTTIAIAWRRRARPPAARRGGARPAPSVAARPRRLHAAPVHETRLAGGSLELAPGDRDRRAETEPTTNPTCHSRCSGIAAGTRRPLRVR